MTLKYEQVEYSRGESLKAVAAALALGDKIDAKYINENCILHHVAFASFYVKDGMGQVFDYMMHFQPDMEATDKQGNTALSVASVTALLNSYCQEYPDKKNNMDIIAKLLEAGASSGARIYSANVKHTEQKFAHLKFGNAAEQHEMSYDILYSDRNPIITSLISASIMPYFYKAMSARNKLVEILGCDLERVAQQRNIGGTEEDVALAKQIVAAVKAGDRPFLWECDNRDAAGAMAVLQRGKVDGYDFTGLLELAKDRPFGNLIKTLLENMGGTQQKGSVL